MKAFKVEEYFSELDIKYQKVSLALLGDFRLDSSYYSNSESIIHKIRTKPLSELCKDVFMGPIFKRDEVSNNNYGVRFFASSEIISYDPDESFITSVQAIKLNLIVKKGMILVTGYGTIGSVRIVDEIIQDFAVADNVTRIIPFTNIGYIACFLSSKYGHQLLNDYASGAAVQFIQAHSIAKIPIPVLTEIITKEINDLFLKAVKCREKAHLALEKTKKLVLQYNNLPPLSEAEIETIDPEKEVEIRSVNNSEFTADYRLDAHFYNPLADLVFKNIRQNANCYKALRKLSDCSFRGSRSTRNYVSKEHGTPFLSGKNIIQIRPDLKYISNSETTNINDMLIEKNWILITRSGTLGRTAFVWNNYEKYAASEHLIRVVPFENKIDQGYLYAFLSSDYGYHQLLRYKHGSVIDEITEEQISQAIIPIPTNKAQKEIGDLVREAYDLRAEAIKLEDEAQEILTKALTDK